MVGYIFEWVEIIWDERKFWVNSSPLALDLSKMKAIADNKRHVAQMIIFVFDRVENIVGKGENAGNQHVHLFFSQCFQKLMGGGEVVVKSLDCV